MLPKPALALQAHVLGGARGGLRVHEQQHAQLLRLRPERIELAVGQLLPFDAAADGGAAQAELSDRLVQLIGREVGMLQRQRRHPDEAIGVLGAPLRDLFVLERDEIARQRAIGRVAPGVDVDRLVVDALRVHVDQALRIAQHDVAGEVGLGAAAASGVSLTRFHHLRHEAVGVNIDRLDAAAADRHLAALARRCADLTRWEAGLRQAVTAHERRPRSRRPRFGGSPGDSACACSATDRV